MPLCLLGAMLDLILLLFVLTKIAIAPFPGHRRSSCIFTCVVYGISKRLVEKFPTLPSLFNILLLNSFLILSRAAWVHMAPVFIHVFPIWKLILVGGLSFVGWKFAALLGGFGKEAGEEAGYSPVSLSRNSIALRWLKSLRSFLRFILCHCLFLQPAVGILGGPRLPALWKGFPMG